jgi:hypothetical protein
MFQFSPPICVKLLFSARGAERHFIKLYIDVYVKCRLFLSGFNESWFVLNTFAKKYSNIKFHENTSNERVVVPCGRTDGRIDITKQIVTFHNLRTRLKHSYLLAFSNDIKYVMSLDTQ